MADQTRRKFHVNQNSWGAQAERKVRWMLEELPMDHFIVMNDIKFKYGNIDHLVIRDDGMIFLIETKSHRGTVALDNNNGLRVNGRPFTRNPICQINRNIRWLREFFRCMWRTKPWFVAVLVFPNGKIKAPKGISLKHVNIINGFELLALLTGSINR